MRSEMAFPPDQNITQEDCTRSSLNKEDINQLLCNTEQNGTTAKFSYHTKLRSGRGEGEREKRNRKSETEH